MSVSKRRIFQLIILIAIAGCTAATAGTHLFSASIETHGELTVKLLEKFTLLLSNGTSAVAWSPDDTTLGVASNFGTKFNTYDASGHMLSEFKSSGNNGAYLNAFAFLNGSSQVLFPVESIAGDDAAADIRNVATGQIVKTITRARDKDYSPNATKHFAVSPDQKRFAIVGGGYETSIIYSTKNGEDWHEKAVTTPASYGLRRIFDISLSFFPDGKSLAIGQSDGHFKTVDSSTGETLRRFQFKSNEHIMEAIAVSPKGDLLLVGQIEAEPPGTKGPITGGTSIWQVKDGKPVNSLGGFGHTGQAVWDPQDRFVAFIDSNSLVLWQPQLPGKNFIRIKYTDLTASLALTHDGQLLAVAEGKQVTSQKL